MQIILWIGNTKQEVALRWVAISPMQWFWNKKLGQVLQWKVKSGVGLFQDEYAEGHGDTRQQAQSLNDPITGFEMDPGAEFRNLKWKGRGEAILQPDKWLTPKRPLGRRGFGKCCCKQFLNAPREWEFTFLRIIRVRLIGVWEKTIVSCLQFAQRTEWPVGWRALTSATSRSKVCGSI